MRRSPGREPRRSSEYLVKRLAIDPGDVHVGWAYDATDGVVQPLVGEWRPAEAIDAVVHMMTQNKVEELIIEAFNLQPDKAADQYWSDFKTSQLIGGLKVVAYFFRVPVYEQKPTIKKSTERQLKARGIKRSAAGKGIHASDAELHLQYRTIRSNEG